MDKGIEYEMTCLFDFGEIHVIRGFLPLTAPPHRCGTLTHDNHDVAPHGAPEQVFVDYGGPDWTGSLTFTPGGTAIIRGEKPESTYSRLKEQNED